MRRCQTRGARRVLSGARYRVPAEAGRALRPRGPRTRECGDRSQSRDKAHCCHEKMEMVSLALAITEKLLLHYFTKGNIVNYLDSTKGKHFRNVIGVLKLICDF